MNHMKAVKQNEIGFLPREWEVGKLGEVCDQRNEIIQPTGKGMFKFIGLEHIEPGKIKPESFELDLNIKSSKFRFYRNDILYGKLRPYLDKAVITDFDGICSTDLIVLTPNEKRANSEFLIYILHFDKFISHAISTTSGTNHPRTSWKAISKFKLPLPPLPEQEKIAEILSTVDKAIEKVDEAIEKTQRLKKGLMQELLTGRRNTVDGKQGRREFKQTEIGRIPKEWEAMSLSEVFKLASGKSRPSEISEIKSEEMPYPIYGGNGILGYTIRFMTNEETIVIGRVGEYCGSIHKTTKSSWITDNALYATNILNHNISLDFLTYWLSFINLNKFKKESGQPLMTQTIVYSIKLPLPPLTEQKKIAEILGTVDKRLELLRKKREKLERVKKGFMNDLLSGRKRVKISRQ